MKHVGVPLLEVAFWERLNGGFWMVDFSCSIRATPPKRDTSSGSADSVALNTTKLSPWTGAYERSGCQYVSRDPLVGNQSVLFVVPRHYSKAACSEVLLLC